MSKSQGLIDEDPGEVKVEVFQIAERRFATVLRNELVDGNEEIAQRVMRLGRLKTFPSGHHLIEKGNIDDCVYFILSGGVDVSIGGRHIDVRKSPETVGEMAAKKPGAERTADVYVGSKPIEVLVLSGDSFRQIMSEYAAFSERLADLIDRLSRSKISQLGEKVARKWLTWEALSGIIAVLMGGAGSYAAWLVGLKVEYVFWTIVLLPLATFVFVVQLNPALRYRNIATTAAGGLLSVILYGSISFVLTFDGQKIDLPLVDFSVDAASKVGVFFLSCAFLIMLFFGAAHYDQKLTGSREQ